jgi:hypothetical protein
MQIAALSSQLSQCQIEPVKCDGDGILRLVSKLREKMKREKGDDEAWVEFWRPRDIVANIKYGVTIRICNDLKATGHL